MGDVLSNHAPCADGDVDRYLKLLFAEKKLSDDSFETVSKIEEKQLDGNPLDSVRLDSLKVGEGVNAIKPGAQIDFASDVTVIFGENGSGKSGLVRVIKRAAGVRTAEEILHNIHDDKRASPSALFGVTVATVSEQVEWKNEFGIAPVNRTNIFDSRGARLHVEEDLSYVYTPGELTLYPFVQNGIERVRTALEVAIGVRTPGANTLLEQFDPACSIYATIETLGSETEIDDIRAYAVLPANFETTIESLTREIDSLSSTNVHNELKRARDRGGVVQSLKALFETVGAFDVVKYVGLIEARKAASRRQSDAGSKAFDGHEIPGVMTGEWHSFILAAEEYLDKHASENYPDGADSCIYCQQPLTRSAVELIKKYRDFVDDYTAAALEDAERELSKYVAPILALDIDVLQRQYDDETNNEDDVLESVAPILEEMRRFVDSVKDGAVPLWPEKEAHVIAANKVVAGESSRMAALVSTLQTSLEKRQEILKEKQTALIELRGRKAASNLFPQIEKRVYDAKWVSRANIIKHGMSAVLRSLTEAAKEASDELLNRGFEKRFQDESRNLRAPNVTLNFPGRQGQVIRRKMVAAYKPNQILSEGELKALALADFLAEVTAVPASSPVVFDDPITSMDYRRIHEVSDRIVSLANDHQIIVFTHNIWFAAELLAKADKKNWKYYDIRSEGGDSGVLSSANHPRVDTIAQVSSRTKKMIEGAEKADGEVRSALIEKGYEELRGLCEIVVEHEMFKGVVQRYAPNVMMTNVEKINVDKLQESMAAVIPVFDKACRYIASHSQPIETQCIRPTLDELKADFEAVSLAREPHKAK